MCLSTITNYRCVVLIASMCIAGISTGYGQNISPPSDLEIELLDKLPEAVPTIEESESSDTLQQAQTTQSISEESESSDTLQQAQITQSISTDNSLLIKEIKESAEYKQLYDRIIDITNRRELWYTQRTAAESGLSTSDNGYHQSGALYGLSNATLLFNDRMFLDTAIAISLEYISNGKDLDSDGYNDWYWGHESEFNRLNHDHYEWRAAMGVAYVAATLLKLDSQTQNDINTLTLFKNYLQKHVWEKWSPPNSPAGRDNLFTSGSEYIARLSITAFVLDKLTDDPQYREFLNNRSALLIGMLEIGYNSATDSTAIAARFDGTQGSFCLLYTSPSPRDS